MARTQNSIVINAPWEVVFDITNDIESWSELFNEYGEAKILKREGNKITFQLTNKEGNSWRSHRIVDKENKQAIAEREEPKFPFKYMHLKWTYEEVPEGTRMTWMQDFEMDPKGKYNDEQATGLINEHSVENQKRIKKIIEDKVCRKEI